MNANTSDNAAAAASTASADDDSSARSPAVTYVFRIEPDGLQTFTYVSQACLEVYGFTAQQAVSDARLMHDAIHPADRGRFEAAAEASLETLGPLTWEGRILRFDGRERQVLITSRPQRLLDGATEWHGVVVQRNEAAETYPSAATSTPNAEHAEILAKLGHELGAPLAAIVGYADWGIDVLRRDRSDVRTDTVDAILLRCFEVIARQTQRLSSLRDDLLATTPLESGPVQAQPPSVRVLEHLNRAADLRRSDLQVHINCPDDLTCLVQPDHLDQILANLVANADRFAHSQIWLTGSAFGDRIRVSVADDGPGVAPETLDRLFARPSYHGNEALSDGGTGLGLYIVRSLAMANGGTVVYDPQRPGARFTFTLPPRRHE